MPDAELLRLIDEMLEGPPRPRKQSTNRAQRARLARHMEAVSRELKARGMCNPPWWVVRREWEIEDLPISAREKEGRRMPRA